MKTRADVEKLKADWLRDPCYDLYDNDGVPDGFEEYEAELHAFQAEHMDRWKKEREERAARINDAGSHPASSLPTRWEFAKAIAAGLAARPDFAIEDIAASAVKIADELLDRLSRE